MRYRILLFDLDDTLLDFRANERASLAGLFERHGYAFSEALFQVYRAVDQRLWDEYENGTMALEQVLNTRFSETMLRLGQAVDGVLWERQYRELLGEGSQLVDGALALCRSLSETHRLFAITNGVSRTQIRRLKLSGLHEFFEDILDSQSVGFQKPSKGFFDHIMASIRDFDAGEALIIGDSLNADIRGGLVSGIDTCWLNPRAEEPSPEIPSTYTAASLAEVYEICRLPKQA